MFTLSEKEIKKLLPKRIPDSNKGTYGHALCLCGSMKMTGACYLSVSAALRTGAGLVTAGFPCAAYPALAPKFAEALMLPLKSNSEGTFSFEASDEISAALKKATSVLIGCGMGNNDDTAKFTLQVIKKSSTPLVIDADGLNVISGNPAVIKEAHCPVIVTPHPGEMSRLTGKSIEEILDNPVKTAQEFSQNYGCVTVLKIHNTVVSDEKGERIYINKTGNSGLSKGGSGDLLAGITVSLSAQGMSPFDSAVSGVFIHGGCADEVAQELSERGMLPSDVLNHLPHYLAKFE